MHDFSQTMQELPWSGLIPLGLLLVLGVLLWIKGQKILKAGFAGIGLIVGGLAGWVVGEIVQIGVPAWGFAIAGAIILTIVGVLAYRVAVALAMALLLAVAGPLGAVAASDIQARYGNKLPDAGASERIEITYPVADEIDAWLKKQGQDAALEAAQNAAENASAAFSEQIKNGAKDALKDPEFQAQAEAQLEKLKQFATSLSDSIKTKWETTPEHLRPTLRLSAAIGGLIGLILGIIAPSFSAAAITALGGSLLWLTCLQMLLVRAGVPTGPWFPTSGLSWMLVWLITASVGLGIQWIFRKPRADKSERS